MSVELPGKREELQYYLQALSNRDFQERAWVQGIFPPGVVYDSFDYAINFFFDDTHLADNPQGTVGWILEDAREVAAVQTVTRALDHVLKQQGTDRPVTEYLASSEWQAVIEASDLALAIVKSAPERESSGSIGNQE